MKKIIFLSICFLSATISFAQDEKYTMAIEARLADVDTLRKHDDLVELSALFERIALAEKTKWLPFYYAALTQVNAAISQGVENMQASKTDAIADKAEQLINKADELSPNNSEVYVVKKMIASIRLMVDPMTRYMKYGPIGEEALVTAKKLNANNPRVLLLEAQDKYFTPEQFGGSKEEAKILFEESKKKFSFFKPASSLDPNWGMPAIEYFLSLYNK